MSGKESPRFESMDEDSVCKSIPISQFKSSTLTKKRTIQINTTAEDHKAEEDCPLSPGTVTGTRNMDFKNIDQKSVLSVVTGGVKV